MSEIDYKQVIVVRKDLNMRKGKMVAQGAHAALAAVIKDGFVQAADKGPDHFCIPLDYDLEMWLTGRFKKICVYVNTEQELIAVHAAAQKAGLRSVLIKDAGLTEFGGVPTHTTVCVGPHPSDVVDKITGHLPLL